jgi:DNA-binding response OmpR family regulator
MNKLIYVADDEKNIRQLIESFLINEGYRVKTFENGNNLLEEFNNNPADLVILDIMMPGTDGLTICSRIRSISNIPIIIVSAKDSEIDRITGISIGSDDYLTKPFSPIELVVRIKAIFRRMQMQSVSESENIVRYSDLTINMNVRSIVCDDKRIDLTPTELLVVEYLIRNKDRAVSREELLKNVWKYDFEVDTRATDDIVKRLRKKLTAAGSKVKIDSVWGFGFRILECEQDGEN